MHLTKYQVLRHKMNKIPDPSLSKTGAEKVYIKLWADRDIRVKKMKIGRVPVLTLESAMRPVIPVGLLWIHGGGFITGMKEMVFMSRAVNLVRRFGVTVISPDYRLAWRNPYPAAIEGCFQVLRYLDGKFRILMVGGESAGGGLAAALCMMARDKGIKVDYQIPLYPMLSNIDTESSRDNHGRIWNSRRNHFGWRMYLRGNANQKVSPYAAPAWQEDYSGLPPCYTFVGDGEPFYAETLEYVRNLKAAGIEAKADVYHTNIHAFDMLYPDQEPAAQAIKHFEDHFENVLNAFLT